MHLNTDMQIDTFKQNKIVCHVILHATFHPLIIKLNTYHVQTIPR